jgi:alkyl hydroperoxide reductase subunit AhpF
MGLLSEQDRQVVAQHLAALTQPVTILFFTQTIGAPDTVLVTKQILDEIGSLTDKITIEEVNLILDRDRAASYGIEHVPALVLLRAGADTGIRFLGAPAGYEFLSLIEALVLAGSDDSGLSADSKTLIAAHVREPLELLVFTTPT